jgi:hypothetical protein
MEDTFLRKWLKVMINSILAVKIAFTYIWIIDNNLIIYLDIIDYKIRSLKKYTKFYGFHHWNLDFTTQMSGDFSPVYFGVYFKIHKSVSLS